MTSPHVKALVRFLPERARLLSWLSLFGLVGGLVTYFIAGHAGAVVSRRGITNPVTAQPVAAVAKTAAFACVTGLQTNSAVNFPAAGGMGSLIVFSHDCSYMVKSSADWLVELGHTSNRLTYRVGPNPLPIPRAAKFLVDCIEFTVTQLGRESCQAGTPSFVPAALPAGLLNQPYQQTFTQSGSTGAVELDANNSQLPAGLSFANGVLAGVPTQAGAFPLTLRTQDACGGVVSQAYLLVIRCPSQHLALEPKQLAEGVLNTAYSQTLRAAGGSAPYRFQVAGRLPLGLELTTGGVLTGTPLETGVFKLRIAVTSAEDCGASNAHPAEFCDYVLLIKCAETSLTLAPATLPDGTQGATYAPVAFSAQGGAGPYTFTAYGDLPKGLRFENGKLAGTPEQAGVFTLTVVAYDVAGCPVGSAAYDLLIRCASAAVSLQLTPPTVPTGSVDVPYPATQFTVTGGSAPYQFSLSGKLPAGLSFSAAQGELSGTPTEAGIFTFTVAVSSADGCASADSHPATRRDYLLVIGCPPPTPQPNLTASNNGPVCEGGTLALTATTILGAQYRWVGPSGFRSAEQNPRLERVTVAAAGVYTVAAELNGCPVLSLGSTTVAIGSAPSALLANSVSLCEGATLVLSAPSLPGANYRWTGPNGFVSTEQNPQRTNITAKEAGEYTVIVTLPCATVTGQTTVAVNPLPARPTLPPEISACEAGVLQLNAPVIPNASYAWRGPNNFTSNLPNPTLTPVTAATAGVYELTVTVNGCVSPPTTTRVSVLPPLPVVNTALTLCEGATLSLTAPSIAGAAYRWAGPNSFVSNEQNPQLASLPLRAAGEYFVTILANGCMATSRVQVSVTPRPNVQPFSLPSRLVNELYTQTFSAAGGTGPVQFALSGNLPPGLNFDAATATLTGTPTLAGVFRVTVSATTAAGCTSARAYDLVINGDPYVDPSLCNPVITPVTLPSGKTGVPYEAVRIAASGNAGAYELQLAGQLPIGMKFSTEGILSGTPGEFGCFPFTITAKFAQPCGTGKNPPIRIREYVLVVDCNASPITIALPDSLPAGTAGELYLASGPPFLATGGLAPYSYDVFGLPDGLQFTQGMLKGIPRVAGAYTVTVVAKDANGCAGRRDYPLRITCPALKLLPDQPRRADGKVELPKGSLRERYAQTLSVTPAVANPVFTVTGGALPPGLTLLTNGTLSGTPAAVGNFNFTAKVQSGSCSVSQEFTLEVNSVLVCGTDLRQLVPADVSESIVTYTPPAAPPGTTVTCTPPSGASFKRGVTQVTCSAPNAGSCGFTVTLSSCLLNPPAALTVEVDAKLCGANVNYTLPTTTGMCTPVTCAPAPGSLFPVGVTTVTCASSDPTGVPDRVSFKVTVKDTTAPRIDCANKNLSLLASAPQVVTYSLPEASDTCSTVQTPVCTPPSGATFPVGVTQVNCTVADAAGNTASCGFTITLSGCVLTPPLPPDLTVTAAPNQCAASVNYPLPTTSGNCGSVTCSPPPNSSFPVGVTQVNCSVSDAAGIPAKHSFNVTVKPALPLALSCPGAQRAYSSNGSPVTVTYPAPRVGNSCGTPQVNCEPPSGSNFAIGVTTVNCRAQDNSGIPATCSFPVGVTTCEPVCPSPVTVNADAGQCSAVVNYTIPPNSCPVTCLPAPGANFPVGVTTVTCTSRDAAGVVSTCSFPVTVKDAEKPVITCPPTQHFAGIVARTVGYTLPTATDNCTKPLTPECQPPSGATFNPGVTTVNCTATDTAGNAASCSFNVAVNAPPSLSAAFAAPSLVRGETTQLTFTLTNPNSTVALTGLSFTGELTPGLPLANTVESRNTCGGTLTAAANNRTLALSGGTVSAGGKCEVQVNVTGLEIGEQMLQTSNLNSVEGGLGNAVKLKLSTLCAVKPVIVTQNPTGCGDVSLSTTARPGFTYQWLKDGEVIPGATVANYTAHANGSYTVQATQGACTVGSAPVAVTVLALPSTPVITQTPDTLCAGQPVTLTAPAGYSSYAWTVRGDNRVLSSFPTLTDTPSTTTTTTTYQLTVTNAAGCAVTTQHLVTVNLAPVVTPPTFVEANCQITLQASARGTLLLKARWERKAVNQDWEPLATDPPKPGNAPDEVITTLVVAASEDAIKYQYRAVFSDTCNTVPSVPITLTLKSPLLTVGGTLDFGTGLFPGPLPATPPSPALVARELTFSYSSCTPLNVALSFERNDPAGQLSNRDDGRGSYLVNGQPAPGPFYVKNAKNELVKLCPPGTAASACPSLALPATAAAAGAEVKLTVFFEPLLTLPLQPAPPAGQKPAAYQVLPSLLKSKLTLLPERGAEKTVELNAGLDPKVRLLNPCNLGGAPLVKFSREGDQFVVETTVYDADLDVAGSSYTFLAGATRFGPFTIDKDLVDAIALRKIVPGQSFTIEQRFSGANGNPQINDVEVTIRDGAGTPATARAGASCPSLTTATESVRAAAAVVDLWLKLPPLALTAPQVWRNPR